MRALAISFFNSLLFVIMLSLCIASLGKRINRKMETDKVKSGDNYAITN
jgi:hypothetical protein